jgi:alkylation response protein AidB-like acyl-CoA dehydrogenase
MTAATLAPTLSPAEAEEFRARCREFLAAHTVGKGRRDVAAAKEFQGKLAEAGLAGLTYAKEYGGAGLTLEHERIYRQVAQEFPAMTSELVISQGMCLPVLNEFGTEEQKRRFMPDNISARTVWCQMFSEPGAGSDVASLQTRADRDGDEWILNGQKVWTTLAPM